MLTFLRGGAHVAAFAGPASEGLALEASSIGPCRLFDKAESMIALSSNEHGATALRVGTAEPHALSATSYPFFLHSVLAGLIPPFSSFFVAILDHY